MAEFPAYKTIKTADLIPYARNSRTHSDAQVAKLAASIKEFGFLNPVIVDGDNGIIAGHGRILAAQKLGLEAVPTIEADHLSEAQRRAYVIADNRLALDAGWDDELLRIELSDLDADNFDLSLTGFDMDEIALYAGIADELDAMPDLPSGEKEPFQQVKFVLHDDQVEKLKAALSRAIRMGEFANTKNENKNGNALERIVDVFEDKT